MTSKDTKIAALIHVSSVALLYLQMMSANGAALPHEKNKFFNLSLQELLQIEITGSTKAPERIATVLSSVTTYTYSDISVMGLSSLEQLVNFVPPARERVW